MHTRERNAEDRSREDNPVPKNFFNHSKTHPASPSVDQLALCHLLLQGNGYRIHQLSKYRQRTKASLPGFVGTGTIPTHRPTSPPESSTACDMFSPSVPAWHQHPELCPLPLPVSPWVFSEVWAAWTIQGVPSHTEPTSLCSAPVSTTNNRSSPPLIEALNNPEQVPSPPTKANLPSPQSTAATHTGPSCCFTKAGLFAWKASIARKTATSKQRSAWIPGKSPWQRASRAFRTPHLLSRQQLG